MANAIGQLQRFAWAHRAHVAIVGTATDSGQYEWSVALTWGAELASSEDRALEPAILRALSDAKDKVE
jgi:hypothetical protein